MCLNSQCANCSLRNTSTPSGTNSYAHHLQSDFKQPPHRRTIAGLHGDWLSSQIWVNWKFNLETATDLWAVEEFTTESQYFPSCNTTEERNPAAALSMWAVWVPCPFARHCHVVSLSRVCPTMLTFSLSPISYGIGLPALTTHIWLDWTCMSMNPGEEGKWNWPSPSWCARTHTPSCTGSHLILENWPEKMRWGHPP